MTPGVLVVGGPPCSGKSSIARLLSDVVLIQVDALFDLLLPSSDRNRDDRMLAYDAAHAVARMLVDAGRTPVLECTYARRDQRAGLVAALPASVPLRVVELRISPTDAVRRSGQRTRPPTSTPTACARRSRLPCTATRRLPAGSTSGTPSELVALIVAWLADAPPVDRDRWVGAGLDWT